MSKVEIADPKGLIGDAYCIEDISAPDCRTIFVNWAMAAEGEVSAHIAVLIEAYAVQDPDHPMSVVLRAAQGTAPSPGRKGGAAARRS